jgi:hypothetical protein
MKAPRVLVAAMASLGVSAFASQVQAQPPNTREAIIQKCELQAQKHYPYKGGDDSRDRARISTYKDCMNAAGSVP